PMLNELAKEYAPQGLKVVGVSMDDDADLILTRRFLARYKPASPNYRKKAGEDAGVRQFTQTVLPRSHWSLPAKLCSANDTPPAGGAEAAIAIRRYFSDSCAYRPPGRSSGAGQAVQAENRGDV